MDPEELPVCHPWRGSFAVKLLFSFASLSVRLSSSSRAFYAAAAPNTLFETKFPSERLPSSYSMQAS